MPKNPSSWFRREHKNYYKNDGYNWRDQNWIYRHEYQENHQPKGKVSWQNSNSRNRRQWPYNCDQRGYHQNFNSGQKHWLDRKGEQTAKQTNTGYNQQAFGQNKNRRPQNDNERLLESLNRRAETLYMKKDNLRQNIQSSTIKEKENEKKGEEILTEKHLPPLNFNHVLEEHEVAYKTLKFTEELGEYREELMYLATSRLKLHDDETVKTVRLFQSREDLVDKTKKSRLYRAVQDQIKKTGLRSDHPKTPETALATSKWKENYFKPWILDLSRLYYKCLDENGLEDDGTENEIRK